MSARLSSPWLTGLLAAPLSLVITLAYGDPPPGGIYAALSPTSPALAKAGPNPTPASLPTPMTSQAPMSSQATVPAPALNAVEGPAPASLALAAGSAFPLPLDPIPPAGGYSLLIEPMNAEWEARLAPPLLQSLLKRGPYVLARTEAVQALHEVATTPNRLALMRRSSLEVSGSPQGIEVLEIGPAACLALVVREDSYWLTYADLNYAPPRPLRIEAVSPGALRDVEWLLGAYPLAVQTSLLLRPTHIAIQRLSAGEVDVVALDVPRRGSSNEPAEVVSFALSRQGRLLEMPQTLAKVDKGGRQLGEVILSKGWFWEEPKVSQTLCDPFVLALPAAGADQFIHSLYAGLAGDSGSGAQPAAGHLQASAGSIQASPPPAEEGFLARILAAFKRFLIALGIISG